MRRALVVGLAVVVSAVVLSGCVNMEPMADTSDPAEGSALPAFGLLSPQQAVNLLESKLDQPDFVLLDIRTPAEVEAGHLGGAVMIDYYSESFRDQLEQLDRSLTYLIYCRTGNRTGSAYRLMQELGFTSVYDLDGGITEWIAQGYPVCIGALGSDHACETGGYAPDS